MKNKILSFALVISIMASLFVALPITANAATEGEEGVFTYTIENGEVTITDCDESASGDIVIPETIEGYPVTNIGGYVFHYCDCLTSITMPDSVTTIGDFAFFDCYSLTSITIPGSVTSIGFHSFSGCAGLTSISIPSSVTFIGEYAFTWCYSLTNINVDEDNKNYSSENGNLFNKEKTLLIRYVIGESDSEYIIPDSVTSIGSGAFSESSNLKSIIIPAGVTTIGDDAFFGCGSLTSITIPEGVTKIGNNVFFGCDNLKSIRIPDSVTSIGDLAFYSCDSLTDAYFGGTEEEWDAIKVGSGNGCLTNATIHFDEEEPEYLIGDADGDGEISLKDAISIRRFIVGRYGIEIHNEAADVNKDGRVDIKDVIMIRRYLAGGYGVEI